MPITARQSPTLILFGVVQSLRSYNWEGEYRGTRFTIDSEGGPLQVLFRPEADNQRPELGKTVAILVSVFEGQNGASLTFERHIQGADLEHIGKSVLGVKAA